MRLALRHRLFTGGSLHGVGDAVSYECPVVGPCGTEYIVTIYGDRREPDGPCDYTVHCARSGVAVDIAVDDDLQLALYAELAEQLAAE